MTTTETWTFGRLLSWTTEYLQKHGSQSGRLDSEILLAHAADCERIHLYASFNDEPTEEVKAAFREMVKRRAEGTPVAYLVGYKEFYSTSFEVNPDVLIPRPETEHLVMEAIDRARELESVRKGQPLRIADIGTGSGAIAITIAKQLPDATIVASDVSPAALEVARRNAERNEVGDRVEFLESDLLSAHPEQPLYDLILSNPPYVSEQEFDGLEKTVREYEPRQALVGGPEGFELIVQLLEQAKPKLAEDGFLICEFSPMLAKRQSEFVNAAWECKKLLKDLAQLPRAITLQLQK